MDLSKPTNIFSRSMDVFYDVFKEYFKEELRYDLGDNFSIESNYNIDINSDYYYNQSVLSNENLVKYNYIKNLDKLNGTVSYKQDKNNRKFVFETHNKLNEEELLGYKLYSENSTKFYLIDGITTNYINDGNCNYFETLTEEDTTKSNVIYLYNYIFTALNNSFSDEDFNEYDKVININGRKINAHQISTKINDKKVHTIINSIFDEMMKDPKASSIINNAYGDISKFKVSDDYDFFNSNENIDFSIYTSQLFYKPLKYEIVYRNGNILKTFTYIPNEHGGEGYLVDGDRLLYKIVLSKTKDSIGGTISDSKDKQLGTFKLSKDNTGIDFSLLFDEGDNKGDILYSSKFTDVVPKKSFTNEKTLSYKIIENNVNMINLQFNSKGVYVTDFMIDEDINNTVIKATLSEEVINSLNNKMNNVIERLKK